MRRREAGFADGLGSWHWSIKTAARRLNTNFRTFTVKFDKPFFSFTSSSMSPAPSRVKMMPVCELTPTAVTSILPEPSITWVPKDPNRGFIWETGAVPSRVTHKNQSRILVRGSYVPVPGP